MTARPEKYILDRSSGIVPQFQGVGVETSGDTTLVAARYGQRIRVYAVSLFSADDVVIYFRSDAGGTAITGSFDFHPRGDLVMPFSQVGWFETADGATLEINLSADVYVGGVVVYGYV